MATVLVGGRLSKEMVRTETRASKGHCPTDEIKSRKSITIVSAKMPVKAVGLSAR